MRTCDNCGIEMPESRLRGENYKTYADWVYSVISSSKFSKEEMKEAKQMIDKFFN